jgi:hypothetical protein
MIGGMRLGIADHFGWAVAVTASADHAVVDRRWIELIEPGVCAAPIHYESRRLDVAATAALVASVRVIGRAGLDAGCAGRRGAAGSPGDVGAALDEGPSDRSRRSDRQRKPMISSTTS